MWLLNAVKGFVVRRVKTICALGSLAVVLYAIQWTVNKFGKKKDEPCEEVDEACEEVVNDETVEAVTKEDEIAKLQERIKELESEIAFRCEHNNEQ